MGLDSIIWRSGLIAGMAELADAADSKSADRKVVGVRPPLPAPSKIPVSSVESEACRAR
jgi:hypothetical protein